MNPIPSPTASCRRGSCASNRSRFAAKPRASLRCPYLESKSTRFRNTRRGRESQRPASQVDAVAVRIGIADSVIPSSRRRPDLAHAGDRNPAGFAHIQQGRPGGSRRSRACPACVRRRPIRRGTVWRSPCHRCSPVRSPGRPTPVPQGLVVGHILVAGDLEDGVSAGVDDGRPWPGARGRGRR